MLFKEDVVARAQSDAVRNHVGWFRWTHDLVSCEGPDAGKFLDYLLVNRIADLEIERESYEDIAQGEIVYKRGVPVGIVRAMIYGYTVDKNIGFGILDAKKAPVGTLVKIGTNMSPAVVVEPKWL